MQEFKKYEGVYMDVKCTECKQVWNVSIKNKHIKKSKYICPDCTSIEKGIERYPTPSRKFRKNK